MKKVLKEFFLNEVMPLLGYPENIINKKEKAITYLTNKDNEISFINPVNNIENEEKLKLYVGLVYLKKYLFYIEFEKEEIDNEQITIANHIIYAFSAVLESNKNLFLKKYNKHIKNYLLSDINNSKYLNSIKNCAIQRGICDWILDVKIGSSLKIERLLEILEKWSQKTYEGHRVCYGILINHGSEEGTTDINVNSFLDFLEDEYSAVISDGISSII